MELISWLFGSSRGPPPSQIGRAAFRSRQEKIWLVLLAFNKYIGFYVRRCQSGNMLCLPSLLTANLASRGFVFYEFVLPPERATPLFRIAGRRSCGPGRKHGRHGHEIGFRANDKDRLGQ